MKVLADGTDGTMVARACELEDFKDDIFGKPPKDVVSHHIVFAILVDTLPSFIHPTILAMIWSDPVGCGSLPEMIIDGAKTLMVSFFVPSSPLVRVPIRRYIVYLGLTYWNWSICIDVWQVLVGVDERIY